MKINAKQTLLILAFLPHLTHGQVSANKKFCVPCNKLKELQLPDVTILEVKSLESDTINGPEVWMPKQIVKVPFCKVRGRISKEINFELLMPQQWNGRFLMSGGGGFVGSIQNGLVDYVNQGFATAGTDTGHMGDGLQADWAFNNMERQLNFGKLAVHRTAVVSKSVIDQLYCSEPSYSYLVGCSRGGGQGMMEAQNYPEDFSGIVAGAPAFTWPATGAKNIEGCQNIYPNTSDGSQPIITNDNLKLLQEYVFQQCDKVDGITDRIITDPRKCKIDLSKLPLCSDNKAGSKCFTQEQLKAIKSVYSPLLVGNKMIHPGFPVGLEAEPASWDLWISGTSPFRPSAPSLDYMFGTNVFKYLIFNDPSWDYRTYEFKNFFKETAYASSYLDATQSDYSTFKKLNEKMILYHGWNDPALSAYSTIQHYEEAMQKDNKLQSHIRLFLLPGVLHCGGGTGPDQVDWVKLIQDWVEHEKAPDQIVLSKIENGKTVMTRPVFPYPQAPVYKGKGDTNDFRSFEAGKN